MQGFPAAPDFLALQCQARNIPGKPGIGRHRQDVVNRRQRYIVQRGVGQGEILQVRVGIVDGVVEQEQLEKAGRVVEKGFSPDVS